MELSPVIKKILTDRGIVSEEHIREFLSPDPVLTYDPYEMKDLSEAADAIIDYARQGRKICIYGDYDSDGVNSTVLMTHLLSYLTENICHYIPSRFDEGYGLNVNAISQLKQQGVEMIVTVDCGCVSYNEVEHGKSLGIFMIVTDHHNIDGRAPDCLLVNPKRQDCGYPCDMLCGCGVAFKIAQAIQRKAGLPKRVLNEVLDLVAIATVGDIVPLQDENRTLVKIGMKRIRACKRPGLEALTRYASINQQEINSFNISFGIVPRINAAGRMASAETAFRLLASGRQDEADSLARQICDANTERKRLQEEFTDKIAAMIKEKYGEGPFPGFLIINAGDAHEGIAGIVAGKIKEIYNRPVLILTNQSQPGMLKGTGRSIEGVDIHAMISKYTHLLTKFGGHRGACGMSLKAENEGAFTEGLLADANRLMEENPEIFRYKIKADAVIGIPEITMDLIDQLEMLEPFGFGNEKPVIALKSVKAISPFRMGDMKNHLRFTAADSAGNRLQCVYFNPGEENMALVESGERLNIYGSPGINQFRGRRTIQFMVNNISRV